ncbi:hypothetical protein [Mangrovibacterium diazotrophicum]|uniref:O-antigen ligase-like membrane protein n=1 Tax=Mangrovibacterium diazotrophicum TaxID=1261403 RepID=A0A419W957_9BACT|nr:hypothetical protein [Mangrovibacterium diazotrophicum]RKD91979.1 hypothetical protein BC643_2348 [Mangrovibacterium diazotrophicum]
MKPNNKFYLYYLLICYILGVLLYDFIGFDYTDEILLLVLVTNTCYNLLTNRVKKRKDLTEVAIVILIFISYLCYSLAIKSNTHKAIFSDFVIQLKPFLAFYCIYLTDFSLADNDKKIIRTTAVFSTIYIGSITLFGLGTGTFDNTIKSFFGHPSRYATTITITSVLYLYACSTFSFKQILSAILILSIGLFSFRSKFFGFFVAAIATLLLRNRIELKINLKNTIASIVIVASIIVVAYSKLSYYFVEGSQNGEIYARPALYMTSIKILSDYFPLGSGLGTFATHASAVDYSPLYDQYDLSSVFGLTPDKRSFISDTFFPSLAQFGFLGTILFFTFWVRLFKKIRIYSSIKSPVATQLITISFLILLFLFIESIADSTFTQNRGLFTMLLLGLSMNDMHHEAVKNICRLNILNKSVLLYK